MTTNNQDETKFRNQMRDLDRKYENDPARQGTQAGTTLHHGNPVPEPTQAGRAAQTGGAVDRSVVRENPRPRR